MNIVTNQWPDFSIQLLYARVGPILKEENMKIEKVAIDKIKCAPYNPRKMKSSEFGKLKNNFH